MVRIDRVSAGLLWTLCTAPTTGSAVEAGPPSVVAAIERIDRNVLDDANPETTGIRMGMDGGEVVRGDDGTLHFFTSEQRGDPVDAATRIAHWTSADGLAWRRDNRWEMLGNRDQTGTRDKASIYDPTMAYDEPSGFWYMYYVSYRFDMERLWFRAKVYRARSLAPGRAGLAGPYHFNDDEDVVAMEAVASPPPYEAKGYIGDDVTGPGATSVTIYQAGARWVMLWSMNMLAVGDRAAGPFTRLPEDDVNPVTWGRAPLDWGPDPKNTDIQQKFYHENPIVIRIPDGRPAGGTFLMMTGNYTDRSIGVTHQTCGYATSPDGLRWSELRPLNAGFGDCATVLSLLPEKDGTYTMFITAHDKTAGEPGEKPLAGAIPVESYERVSRLSISVVPR